MEAHHHKLITTHSQIIKSSLTSGISGCVGVLCQTIGLLWHYNVQHEQVRMGQSFGDTAKHIYRTNGILKLYKGFLPAFRAASLARFGDQTIYTLVMKQINLKFKMQKISLFIKSGIVWGFASTWRLAMLPLLVFSPSDFIENNKARKGKFLRSIRRLYVKRTKPQILSLYFWFTFHAFFDDFSPPLYFKDNLLYFTIRHSIAGFGSMIIYDIFLDVYNKILKQRKIHTSQNVLLGDCQSKKFIKGMHGVIFCTTSNYFKLMVSQLKHNKQ